MNKIIETKIYTRCFFESPVSNMRPHELSVRYTQPLHVYLQFVSTTFAPYYSNIVAFSLLCNVPSARGRPCALHAASSHFGSCLPILLYCLCFSVYILYICMYSSGQHCSFASNSFRCPCCLLLHATNVVSHEYFISFNFL